MFDTLRAKDRRVAARDGMYHGGSRVLSSLGLQMCLYFNAYFFPLWVVGIAVISSAQVSV